MSHPITAKHAGVCVMLTLNYIVDRLTILQPLAVNLRDGLQAVIDSIDDVINELGDNEPTEAHKDFTRRMVVASGETLLRLAEYAEMEGIDPPSEDGPEADGLREYGIVAKSLGLA